MAYRQDLELLFYNLLLHEAPLNSIPNEKEDKRKVVAEPMVLAPQHLDHGEIGLVTDGEYAKIRGIVRVEQVKEVDFNSDLGGNFVLPTSALADGGTTRRYMQQCLCKCAANRLQIDSN